MPDEDEADAARDAFLRQAGTTPVSQAVALSAADTATRAQVVNRLQQEQGNGYVQRVVAELVLLSRSATSDGPYSLHRQEARRGKLSQITRGPGGTPAVRVGGRFQQVWHPGVRIGTNIILDVFEQGGKVTIAWYDFSRSRHESRPMDLFEEWLNVGPVGEMRPSDWRAYQLLDRVPPREWYDHRRDPVHFFMSKLEALRPGTAEERGQIERTLSPAAYRAMIKRIALSNLAESEKQTREILGKGPAFFASLARSWGALEQKRAALETEQARLRRSAPQPAAGVPEPGGISSSEYDLRRIAREIAAVEGQMAARVRQVPLLQVMRRHGNPITAKGIQKTLEDILTNIAKTREAIWTNRLDPMELRELHKVAPGSYARFAVTLRGQQPATEAFSRAKWEGVLGSFLLDVMLIFVTGGVGAFFSAAIGAAETAVAVEKAGVLERGTMTSPRGPGVVGEEAAAEARLGAWLSGLGAALSSLSFVAEMKAIRLTPGLETQRRQLSQLGQEAARLQRQAEEASRQVESLQRRLRELRRAPQRVGRLPAGERAGAQAVLRSTERTAKRLVRELRGEFGRVNTLAHKLKRAAQQAARVAKSGQTKEIEEQIQKIGALVEKMEKAAVGLDVASKVARVPELYEAQREVRAARSGESE